MNTTVCFDFGNTRLKCAVFAGKEIIATEEITEGTPAAIELLLEKYQPQFSILSSVIDHDAAIEDLLTERTKFHKLDHNSKYPITTPVGKPETIGADRLALCVAAVSLYPEQHNLVIGLGSCITFNFVNKFHEFLGGSISPGLEMRFKAMHHFTAKLPLIQASAEFPLIGYDTKTNMLSGVILGMSKEIDGIIDLYCEKYANFNVLLTGGNMGFFAAHLKNKIFAHPNLIFNGLYAISEFNNT